MLCGWMINELHRCESGGKKKKNPIPFHSSCSVSARSPTVYTKQLQFLGYSMLKCAEFHKNKITKPKKKKTSLFSNFVIELSCIFYHTVIWDTSDLINEMKLQFVLTFEHVFTTITLYFMEVNSLWN